MSELEGVLHLAFYYDIGEEVDLGALRSLIGTQSAPGTASAVRMAAPIQFEQPPAEEPLPAGSGFPMEIVAGRIRYFQYGVAEIDLEVPFRCDWNAAIALAARWIWTNELESVADALIRQRASAHVTAIRKPSESFLREDYATVELRRAPVNPAQILAAHGAEIAQIVRGETEPLSDAERAEVLSGAMSYSRDDLFVAGHAAALVYDRQPEAAGQALQILGYANTQLLEYRFYDELLTRVLADVYRRSARKRSPFAYMRSGKEAARLNALRLEVMELSERTDTAIKFVSDMYWARVYKLAAARIGVPDYRRLVEHKLAAAGELYRFMIDISHQGTASVLETVVVIILIIDLIVLFAGRSH